MTSLGIRDEVEIVVEGAQLITIILLSLMEPTLLRHSFHFSSCVIYFEDPGIFGEVNDFVINQGCVSVIAADKGSPFIRDDPHCERGEVKSQHRIDSLEPTPPKL